MSEPINASTCVLSFVSRTLLLCMREIAMQTLKGIKERKREKENVRERERERRRE